MRIISKYKDYYDYLTGLYGVDDKVVLDRRGGTSVEPSDGHVVKLYICGLVYTGVYDNGKYYWGSKVQDAGARLCNLIYLPDEYDAVPHGNIFTYRDDLVTIEPYKDTKQLNRKLDCPILWKDRIGWYYTDSCTKFPKLEPIGIASVLSAYDLYLMLTEWLSYTPDIIDNRDDKLKIQAAGFDLKTSFRKM